MRCMLCGTENREEAKRCKQCGSALDRDTTSLVNSRRTPAPTILDTGAAHDGQPSTQRKTQYVSPDLIGQGLHGEDVSQQAGLAGNVRKTQYVPHNAAADKPPAAESKPRIAGFLVTFTWDLSGQSFPVREGKNLVGSSATCDFVLPVDRAMSNEHFAVMVRNGRVKVRDLTSTNATRVDGAEIWGEAVDVEHGAHIEAGDTKFVLVLLPLAGA